jgi:hypothetical protein
MAAVLRLDIDGFVECVVAGEVCVVAGIGFLISTVT